MNNGLTHFCSLRNGTRFGMRFGGGVTQEAVKTGHSMAKTSAGEYLTMLGTDEVWILPALQEVRGTVNA